MAGLLSERHLCSDDSDFCRRFDLRIYTLRLAFGLEGEFMTVESQ